jgi:hypothetical protein
MWPFLISLLITLFPLNAFFILNVLHVRIHDREIYLGVGKKLMLDEVASEDKKFLKSVKLRRLEGVGDWRFRNSSRDLEICFW